MTWLLIYLSAGAAIGFVAGLLGVGGGLALVPVLVFVFTAKGFPPEQIMHLSIATSMATVLFTSVSSVRSHHKHAGVDWAIAKALTPGVLAGSFAASQIAGFVATRAFALIFCTFLVYTALHLTSFTFSVRKAQATRKLPGTAGLFAAGAAIGGVSSVFAAGGAFLSIPFMTRCNVPLARAIGTASAIGFPIALSGSIGYVLNGLGKPELPEGSLGYIYLPALLPVIIPSMLSARWGARLTHRMPVRRLRIAFAALLFSLAARMLYVLW